MARYDLENFQSQIDVIDLALLAYVLDKASPWYGRTKVQKSVFLVEASLRDRSLTGLYFKFFRYKNGPFSRELADAYDMLARLGHAHKNTVGLTDRGYFLSGFVSGLKKEPSNQQLFAVMDDVLAKCQPESGESLMNDVYEREILPEWGERRAKIRDLPKGVDLIVPRGQRTLSVPEDVAWLINEELRLSDAEIEETRNRWPEWGRQPVGQLLRAIADSRERV